MKGTIVEDARSWNPDTLTRDRAWRFMTLAEARSFADEMKQINTADLYDALGQS